MTNQEWIVETLRNAVEAIATGNLGQVLLQAARSDLNESGYMYDLWCDGCGNCGDPEDMCSDEAQLDCIRRFLERPCKGG